MSNIRVPRKWRALGHQGELLSYNSIMILLSEPLPRLGLWPRLQASWNRNRDSPQDGTMSPSQRKPHCRVQPRMSGALASLLPDAFHSEARPLKGGPQRSFLQPAQKTLGKFVSERQAGIWVSGACLHKGSQPSFS